MKRLSIMLLIISIVFLACACNKDADKQYAVLLGASSGGGDFFKITVPSMITSHDSLSTTAKETSFKFGGTEYSLDYIRTTDGIHVYSSPDKSLTCRFFADSGKLYQITFTGTSPLKNIENKDEVFYINWCKKNRQRIL